MGTTTKFGPIEGAIRAGVLRIMDAADRVADALEGLNVGLRVRVCEYDEANGPRDEATADASPEEDSAESGPEPADDGAPANA